MIRSTALFALLLTLGVAACGERAGDGHGNADNAGATSGDTTSAPVDGSVSTADRDTNAGTATPTMQSAKMNVNTATEEQFRTIPGVGDKMVHEFEEYRPYKSIVQFRKEIGKYVDTTQVATYENYIYVPIDYNESDMETLAQIPGLDMSEANQLVTARPYASENAFFEKLETFVSPDELAIARTYVATK